MPDLPTSPADIDLRLVRYFTVVARHGNFGRAATELRLAQPTLSRYVQRLEKEMGAQLLDRTSQGSTLTEAGEVFLPQALTLLRTAARAAVETRNVARPRSITIGYVGGLIITPAVNDLRRRHPDADVRTVHLSWPETQAALVDHRVDAVVARLPFATEHLHTTVLYQEPRVLLVRHGHPLADRQSVTLDDFAAEPLVRYPDPRYDAFWCIDPRPDGSRAPDGPLADLRHDKLESVAGGLALALAPAADGHGAPRPDLSAVPVTGIEDCTVVLATRAADNRPLIAAFRRSAQSALQRSRHEPAEQSYRGR